VHGKRRYQQGYTAAMLVHESRILQVTLFGASVPCRRISIPWISVCYCPKS
jgi:hypothetical protein